MATTPNSVITPQTPAAGAMNVLLSSAMTNTKAFEGTDSAGTALGLIYTVGANGGTAPAYAKICYASTTGAAASGTSNATVVRFFVNNGSANTTATNNAFIGEISVPAQAYSTTSAMPSFTFPLGMSLPAGYKIYAGLVTAMGGTNCALAVSAMGGGDF